MRGTIRHRNGAWRLQVYAGRDERTGKRKQVTRTVHAPNTRAGRKIADAELARLVLEVEAGRHRLDHDTTLAELLDQWVEARSVDWSPATTYQYRWTIAERIVPHLGALQVHRLRAHDLNTLYATLRRSGGRAGGPLASGTVQKVHVILHSALAYAVRSDLIASNPADHAEKQTVVEADITPPSAEQLGRALAEAADVGPLTLAYVLIAAATGARRGQVVALRWPDIDLDAGEITYQRALVDGGPGVGIVEKGTKTDRRYTVAIDRRTVELLDHLRAEHLERRLADGVPADAFVFSDDGGLTPWRPDAASHRWRRLRARVGLDQVRLHDLRHFMITEAIAAGHDPVSVAGRSGHANPNQVLRRYAHFQPSKDRAIADGLAGILDLPEPEVHELGS